MVSNDSESFEDRVSLDKDVNKNDKATKEVEFDTVEGWKLNTEEEYEDNQFEEPEPEDAEPEGEAEAEGEEK